MKKNTAHNLFINEWKRLKVIWRLSFFFFLCSRIQQCPLHCFALFNPSDLPHDVSFPPPEWCVTKVSNHQDQICHFPFTIDMHWHSNSFSSSGRDSLFRFSLSDIICWRTKMHKDEKAFVVKLLVVNHQLTGLKYMHTHITYIQSLWFSMFCYKRFKKIYEIQTFS